MKKGAAGSDSPFNTRKFWLSSAAFFAGLLAVALLPSCGKAAEPQTGYHSRETSSVPSPAVLLRAKLYV
jgi:hypothetical protein